jgi:6-phosphofructokinase 2
MPPIVTLTLNPAVDKISKVDHVVAERKLRCQEPEYHPGGGGLNVARAITELGGKVEAYWACGGLIGQLLKQLLDDEGVAHHPLDIQMQTRENLIVYEKSSTLQYRFGMPGATLSSDEIQKCMELLRTIDPPPEYLVLSGSLPSGVDQSLYAHVSRAMPSSCRVVLDTSGVPLQRGLEVPVYLIKPNMHELGQLAGRAVEDDSQIRQVARSLIAQKQVQAVVTSLGSGGAVLTTADEHQHVRAPTVHIQSKVGAGDSMVAGLVFALSQGKELADALRFGVAAGSAAVMTAGTELCRKEDTERLYRILCEETPQANRGR